MEKFLITVDFQNSFIDGIERNNIKSWSESHEFDLNKISEYLKKIVVPKNDRKTEALCEFICSSFLLIVTSFWDPNVFHIEKKSKVRKVASFLNPNQNIEKKTIEEFKKSFMKGVKHKEWKKFFKKYYPYFDNIINLARFQKILDIVVETKDKSQYNNFSDVEVYQKSITAKKMETKLRKEAGSISIPAPEQPETVPAHTQTVPPVRYSSATSINSSIDSIQQYNAEAEFQRTLKAQNERFAEKLRKIREERERMNREAEEDMRQFRKESALRIQMFLKCIQLRIRWEEQEQEWGDWLKSVRNPVIRVKNMFLDFNDSRRYNDEEENRSEAMYLHKYVQIAYDKLTHEFESLSYLSDRYEDKLFLRVIQFRISGVATKLCTLMEELEDYQNTEQYYSTVNHLEKQIDSMEIPTTSKLRLICENASPNEYENIVPPKVPSYTCVITEIV